jgi:hypothetical protein
MLPLGGSGVVLFVGDGGADSVFGFGAAATGGLLSVVGTVGFGTCFTGAVTLGLLGMELTTLRVGALLVDTEELLLGGAEAIRGAVVTTGAGVGLGGPIKRGAVGAGAVAA